MVGDEKKRAISKTSTASAKIGEGSEPEPGWRNNLQQNQDISRKVALKRTLSAERSERGVSIRVIGSFIAGLGKAQTDIITVIGLYSK